MVTGMDPLDPKFRRKWTACLECIGQRLFAPHVTGGDELEREKGDRAAKATKRSPSLAAAGGGRHLGS